MNKFNRILILVMPWIMAVVLMLALIKVPKDYQDYKGYNGFAEADTVTVYDTIPCYKPILKDSTVIRYVTVKLPKSDSKLSENVKKLPKSVLDSRDSVGHFGKNAPDINVTSTPDSADVVIPITQKVYGDSMYRAWVSGYEARLDSFHVYRRTEYVTIREKEPEKRFSWGFQAGLGMTPKGLLPYVGAGATIKF